MLSFPIPFKTNFVPGSTNGGILKLIVFCFLARPVPLHVLQGLSINIPLPPHLGQVSLVLIKPPYSFSTKPDP